MLYRVCTLLKYDFQKNLEISSDRQTYRHTDKRTDRRADIRADSRTDREVIDVSNASSNTFAKQIDFSLMFIFKV